MKRILELLGLRESKDRDPDAARHTVYVRSSLDGAKQPCVFIPATGKGPRPLMAYLHPWRHGYDTDSRRWQAEAGARDWHFIAPHFRGPNKRPEACASKLARRDVVDAVEFVREKYAVDVHRIYAGGVSGGAHMALVMAAEAPELWAGVSAWCAVTDLATFYQECVDQGSKAYRHIVKVCGGAPGASTKVDDELRFRSPLFHMVKAKDVPLDINHGVRDGQPKGIGIQHSIWAYNAVVDANGGAVVPQEDLDQLLQFGKRESSFAQASEERPSVEVREHDRDESYGRAIYLRRTSGASRLTIFEGGHEDLPAAACAWLESKRKT